MAKKRSTKKTARKRASKAGALKKGAPKKATAKKKVAKKKAAKKTARKRAAKKKTSKRAGRATTKKKTERTAAKPRGARTKAQRFGVPDHLVEVIEAVPGYSAIETAHKGHYFDAERAQLHLDFFPRFLQFTKGRFAGDPFELEVWQQAIVANLFGWKRANGLRRYDECLLWIARKNGKTTLAAGLALEMLFVDRESGAEIYSGAADAEQAQIVFDIGKAMVVASPELSRRSKPFRRSIYREATDSNWKVVTRDPRTKHGRDAHCVLIDELHAIKDPEFVQVLETSVAARDQPITFYMTTADNDPNSPAGVKYEYASKVRDGIVDAPNFLPVIYEVPLEDDWRDETNWHKANPNLGLSVTIDYLRKEFKKAVEMPALELGFRRLHLNQRVDAEVVWLPMEKWDELEESVSIDRLAAMPVTGGLDMSSNTDITAFTLAFLDETGEQPRFHLRSWYFCPADNARLRERRDRVPYQTWARERHIETTEGDVVDQRCVARRILELRDRFPNLNRIAFDRWGAQWMSNELSGEGVEMVAFGQGFASMSAPSKRFEELVRRGLLAHDGNPVTRWMASNVVVEIDPAENIKPSKKKSTERIDGIVSSIMAVAVAEVGATPAAPSVYETRGVLEV